MCTALNTLISLNTQSMSKNMLVLCFKGKRRRNLGHSIQYQRVRVSAWPIGENHSFGAPHLHFPLFSSISFVPFCICKFLMTITGSTTLVGSLATKQSWCNDSNYQFNVISILLSLFYAYYHVYDLITHAHVCYKV